MSPTLPGNVTVIDARRGIRPTVSAADSAVAARLAALQEKAADRDAHGILELALKEEFAGNTAVVSSFGAESVVLLKLVAEIDPNTPVLFLNTGKLFGETLRYRDRLQDVLGLGDVRSLAPSLAARESDDPDGTLWSRDTDACCNFRKTIPLARALAPFQAQVTGRKRFQTRERAEMRPVEFFEGRYRFNPLVAVGPAPAGSLHRAQRPAAPSPGGGRLSLDRLHALHPAGPGRRGLPRRTLVGAGQGRMRHPPDGWRRYLRPLALRGRAC